MQQSNTYCPQLEVLVYVYGKELEYDVQYLLTVTPHADTAWLQG